MPKRASKKPNVLVFFTDQQRWDTSGLHGNPLGLTPNLDRMARQGTHIVNSFTCQPVCGPARSALQTGLYPTATGCFRNGIPLPQDQKTLAHYFRAGGYTTGYIGKWHLALEEPVTEPNRGGYEYWLASNILEYTSDAYSTVMYDNQCEPIRLPGYRVDALTDASIRYIDAHQNEPFFLFTSYLEPHHQNDVDDYLAPVGYRERYEGKWIPPDLQKLGGSSGRHLAGYWGMVKRIDEALGRMLDALKSLGLLDDTMILFTSDHGNHFRTRNFEYKRSGHEASIRVPTALQGPGFSGGGSLEQMISLIDLPPTLLDAAGLPVPSEMQGNSILPLLRGDSSDWQEEAYVQISESQVGRAIRTTRWKYIVDAPDKNGREDPASDQFTEEALYDLVEDPYELNNLIGHVSHRDVCLKMQERLKRRMLAAGEEAATIESAEAVHGDEPPVSVEEAQQ